MISHRPGTTLETVLGPGDIARSAERQAYRRLAAGPGAARLRRDDLGTGGGFGPTSRSLVYLVHVTDLQIADVQSPGRFEFFETYRGQPGMSALIPAQRAQESIGAHAISEMLGTVGHHLESRDTGAHLQLAVSTGDNLDNAQWNELEWYMALMSGGTVGASRGYTGVQSPDWPGDLYWKPDERSGRFQRILGFPTVPGLLDRAVAPFESPGLPIGWVSCYGNHDGLPFGEVVPTPPYRAIVTGGRKPVALAPGIDMSGQVDALYAWPERFLSGPSHMVPSDERRRIVDRRDFVGAHLAAPGWPAGHGYSPRNMEDGTAYGVVDLGPMIRLVLLDTTNLDGSSQGSLGVRQMQWLEEQLIAVHSSYYIPDGRRAHTVNDDRLVILSSHHGLDSLTNFRHLGNGLEPDQPRVGREVVQALVHRFPNVVLWLNGHRHVNEVAVRAAPGDAGTGFADVATCSIADWPSQARLVELVANEDGTLSVLTQMLDHGAPALPEDATTDVANLASLHRELAANVPSAGMGSALEGSPKDRNVEVVLRAPFAAWPFA